MMLAACASQNRPFAGLASAAALSVTPSQATEIATGSIDQKPRRKTMSDRVLAAIALERVTGLKPDPARLVE